MHLSILLMMEIKTLRGYRNALHPHQNPNQSVLKRCLATLWLGRLVADAFPPEACFVRSLASVLWCCSLWWCAVRHGLLRGSFMVLRHMHMFKGNHDAGGDQSLTRKQITMTTTQSEAQWLHGCCLNLRPRNWLHNLLVLLRRWLRRRFQSLTRTEITMKTTQVLKLSGYTAAV